MYNAHGCGFAFLIDMGGGKTRTAIATAGTLYTRHLIHRVLVIAPTSVVSVWPQEFEEVADFDFECETLLGTKKKRLDQLDHLKKSKTKALKIAAINYESVWREGIIDSIMDYDADLIICDESQRIKSHDAKQSRAIHKLGDKARYKLILTGTPVQNNAEDIFSQYRFLDKSVFGDNYYRFRNHYCVMGGFNNKQIVAYRDMDGLIKKEYSIAMRVTKEEALDLPDQIFVTRKIELTPKTRKLYDRLRLDSFLELENEGTVTATTALTRLLRLQQLTGGFLVADEEEAPQSVSTEKLEALQDIIIDYVLGEGKKLVIFARFLAEVHAIEKLCEKVLPKDMKAVSIYGAIKKEDRGPIIKQFQEDPKTMIILGQIDTLSTGVTLTAASTCVYYSKSYNYATYEQSLSRIHRIGQTQKCTYIDLVADKTVDMNISKALKEKKNLAEKIVDNWRDIFS